MISNYHQKHIDRSDEETQRRAFVKELEIKKILEETGFTPASGLVRIAVLGCAEKRFVKHHKELFERLLQKPVELTTFDITTEHLAGENGIVQHDVTTALPNPPYDITFAHVLLKFIETGKQWDVLQNAYNALATPGLGIFVYDMEDIHTQTPLQADGYFSVPLEKYKQDLWAHGMNYKDIQWKFELEHMPIAIRGLEGGALVLLKK